MSHFSAPAFRSASSEIRASLFCRLTFPGGPFAAEHPGVHLSCRARAEGRVATPFLGLPPCLGASPLRAAPSPGPGRCRLELGASRSPAAQRQTRRRGPRREEQPPGSTRRGRRRWPRPGHGRRRRHHPGPSSSLRPARPDDGGGAKAAPPPLPRPSRGRRAGAAASKSPRPSRGLAGALDRARIHRETLETRGRVPGAEHPSTCPQ